MGDFYRRPLTPAEEARIARIKAALHKRHEDALLELRRFHALSARGECKPLTIIEKIRALLPDTP